MNNPYPQGRRTSLLSDFHHDNAKVLQSSTLDYLDNRAHPTGHPNIYSVLTGPKGSGRGRLIRELADGLPVLDYNTAQSGASPEGLLQVASQTFPKALRKKKPVIVCLRNLQEMHPHAVQKFCGLIKGTTPYELVVGGRQCNVTGATFLFVGLADQKPKESGPLGFGFTQPPGAVPVDSDLMGCFGNKLEFAQLTRDQLAKMLATWMTRYTAEHLAHGREVHFEQALLDHLVESAYESGRGLEKLHEDLQRCSTLIAKALGADMGKISMRLKAKGIDSDEESHREVIEAQVLHCEPRPPSSHEADELPAPLRNHLERPEPISPGTGCLACLADLEAKGMFRPPQQDDDNRLAPFQKATFILQRQRDDHSLIQTTGDLLLPEELRRRNTLVAGLVGSGKTTSVMLPLLAADIANDSTTTVIFDSQGDYTSAAVMLAKTYGRRLIYLDFTDTERSVSWNPLHDITTRAKAKQASTTMLEANGGPLHDNSGDGSRWFRKDAVNRLTLIFEALSKIKGEFNGADMKELLDEMPHSLVKLGDEADIASLERFARDVDSNQNCRTTCMEIESAAAMFTDEEVAAVTSSHELRFEDIDPQNEPCVVVIRLHEHRKSEMEPLVTLLLHNLLDYIKQRGDGMRLVEGSISLFLDEMASACPCLPKDFSDSAQTLRKKGLMLTCAIQTYSQVYERYRERADVILDAFNTRIFVGPVSPSDAARGAVYSGQYEVRDIAAQDGMLAGERARLRYLLKVDEIQTRRDPVFGPCITVLNPETPPFQMYVPPFYQDPAYAELYDPDNADELRPPLRETPLKLTAQTGNCRLAKRGRMTNTQNWPEEEVDAKLRVLEEKLGLSETDEAVQEWWAHLTETSSDRDLLATLEVLINIDADFKQLHQAHRECGIPYMRSIAVYLLYKTCRNMYAGREDEERASWEVIQDLFDLFKDEEG